MSPDENAIATLESLLRMAEIERRRDANRYAECLLAQEQKLAALQGLVDALGTGVGDGMTKIAGMEIVGQSIEHVDATPDAEYPVRILRAYRQNCDMRWEASPPSPLCDELNRLQEQRARLLDQAIAVLEDQLLSSEQRTTPRW